jgi:hypothetical protein
MPDATECIVPKNKNDDVELDFGATDERELKGSDANPIDAATGESLFDDLSPRFVRSLDAAVDKANGRKPPKQEAAADDEDDLDADDVDATDDEDLEDEDDEDADEPAVETADEDEVVDEDADEPRAGRKPTAIERRVARANRIVEETRTQLAELQARERDREAKDKMAADTAEFTTFKSDPESKLAELRAKKAKALDDGDSEAQAAIDEEVIDLKSELRTREREHEAAKKVVEQASKRRGASSITITKVTQWKRKNPRYERDPEFAAAVNAIDASLAAGGSNPESDDHYKELDRRLKKLSPPKVKTPQRRHPSQQQSREESPSVVRRSAGDARVQVKNGKIKISPAKLQRVKENMSRFGLDPTNKKDLQDYILNNPGL